MSTYVMSDLHGNYDSYIKMLELIQLSDDDTLYILGDILDRGPNPVTILLDLMERTNVRILAGNHCAMALECLPFLVQEITEDSIKKAGPNILLSLSDWHYNGGAATVKELRKYDKETQQKIVEFISGLEMYAELSVGGKDYILVHSGLGNFAPDRPLWDYELDELVWERPDYTKAYFDDIYVISGHTPTQFIETNPRPGYIYQANNHIAIDCGCYAKNGRLGCLRLDDMKEFYVETVA